MRRPRSARTCVVARRVARRRRRLERVGVVREAGRVEEDGVRVAEARRRRRGQSRRAAASPVNGRKRRVEAVELADEQERRQRLRHGALGRAARGRLAEQDRVAAVARTRAARGTSRRRARGRRAATRAGACRPRATAASASRACSARSRSTTCRRAAGPAPCSAGSGCREWGRCVSGGQSGGGTGKFGVGSQSSNSDVCSGARPRPGTCPSSACRPPRRSPRTRWRSAGSCPRGPRAAASGVAQFGAGEVMLKRTFRPRLCAVVTIRS